MYFAAASCVGVLWDGPRGADFLRRSGHNQLQHSTLKPSPVHHLLLQTVVLSERQTACTQTSEELP